MATDNKSINVGHALDARIARVAAEMGLTKRDVIRQAIQLLELRTTR